MSRELILANLNALKSTPVAIQALWDGDTTGWFIHLSAIVDNNQLYSLGVLSDGGDIRLFQGQVPPWPEAAAAQQLGSELAERFGAEFYFPSPNYPEDDCPDWRDRNKGYPCRRCGILLLQRPDCPWHGVCYHCHLAEEREQREAKWTSEQRAGPRCRFCGNPATNKLNGKPICADCLDNYEVYTCEKCDGVTTIHKSVDHTSLCLRCEIEQSIDSLNTSQRKAICDAWAEGTLKAIQIAMDITGCSMRIAHFVVRELTNSNATKNPT